MSNFLRHGALLVLVVLQLVAANTVPTTPSSASGDETTLAQTPEGMNSTSGCKNTDLKANEELVRNFYQDEIGDKKEDRVDSYLAKDYINHNPHAAGSGGSADFKRLLKGPLAGPPSKVHFVRVNAVGDVVWAYVSVVLGMDTYVAMDIFRINCDGLIQEHWDVVQNVNKTASKNPIAFFDPIKLDS